MKKFYCTAWRDEDQISAVYTNEEEARQHVIERLAGWFSWRTYDELYELCDAEDWSRDSLILPYGIVEIEAEDEDECFEKVLPVYKRA